MFLKGSSINTSLDMDEIEEEFQKTLKKQPAIRGEIKKTKIRTKLQKSAPELFSLVEEDSYMNIEQNEIEEKETVVVKPKGRQSNAKK
jgi:hypothetical protein